jgi:hypothetical protein
MTDLFREIDEEVRRDEAMKLWQRYGTLIIVLAAVLVIGVAGWRYYDWQRQTAAAAAAMRLESALQLLRDGKGAEAEAALTGLGSDAPPALLALGRLRAAAELAKRDAPAAIAAYDAVSRDPAVDAALQDLARLRAGALALDHAAPADAARRLETLSQPGNVWRFSALELLAAAALKTGDGAAAARHLDAIIIDPAAPAGLRQRAELLIGLTRGAAPAP